MIASRFNRAFQLIAAALVLTMVQVYVMAGPIKVNNDPKANDPSASQPATATEHSSNKVATGNILPTPEAAAEKIALRGTSKTALSRIFSRQNVAERVALENMLFVAKDSANGTFKTAAGQTNSTQTNNQNSDEEDDHSARKGMWIAVGIIAAVGVIAIIGLRHDRNPCRGNQTPAQTC